MTSRTFKFWSLGGSGEVGMNSLLYQFGKTLVPVDAGIVFANANDYGIESLHADYAKFFKKHSPKNWLITHAHEDHIGAIGALFEGAVEAGAEVPEIHAPLLAAELMRLKVLEDTRYPNAHKHVDKIKNAPLNEWFQLGAVEVRFIEGRHSTLQSCSLAFRWTENNEKLSLLHSSDFKLDSEEYEDGVKGVEIYDVFDGKRPDFLAIDSTNSERAGRTVSEKEIIPNLKNLLEKQEGKIFVTLFSSNVYRVSTLLSLAKDLKRTVCLSGRSLLNIHKIARENGFYGKSCKDIDGVEILPQDEMKNQPKHKQLIICSGSQGERRSVLTRLAMGSHSDFKVEEGDSVVLSSKTIPGNEKAVSWLVNSLLREGAQVYWGSYAALQAGGPIHGSGHARRDEIAELISMLKPKNIIPVHGELRQLKSCAELAQQLMQTEGWIGDVHLIENLTELSFSHDGETWRMVEKNDLEYKGRLMRFGNFTAHSLDPFLKDRKASAKGGMVSICLDSMGGVKLQLRGVLPEKGPDSEEIAQGLNEQILEWAHRKYKALLKERVFSLSDRASYEDAVSQELSRVIRRIVGVRPVVLCHLVEV